MYLSICKHPVSLRPPPSSMSTEHQCSLRRNVIILANMILDLTILGSTDLRVDRCYGQMDPVRTYSSLCLRKQTCKTRLSSECTHPRFVWDTINTDSPRDFSTWVLQVPKCKPKPLVHLVHVHADAHSWTLLRCFVACIL